MPDDSASETWLESLEGQQVPDAQGNKVPYCDDCAEPIQPASRVHVTYADKSFHCDPPREFDSLVTMALYGPDCLRPTYPLPHLGSNEVMVAGALDAEGRIWNREVVDAFSADSGIDWSPRDVMYEFLGLSIEAWFARTHTTLAADDVAGLLLVVGINPREVIAQDGSVTDDEDLREEARELFKQFQENNRESGAAKRVMEKGRRQDEWMLDQVEADELAPGEGVFFDADSGEYAVHDIDERRNDDE